MKKIILLIIALISLPMMADAQITIKEKNSIETIKSLGMGWVTLTCSEDYYVLCIQSDNQFDDHYVIGLGSGKAKASASLQALVSIASTLKKNESVTFTTGSKEYSIHRGLTKGEIMIKGEYYAGWGRVSKGQLNTLLDAILFYNN